MSDPVRVPPSGGPGHWRRWLLPVLASVAWLVLTFFLYRHAVQGEQAHLLELCHTRLAATAHQLMDARDWNAGHGGVYVPLSAYGEPNPWLPEKDRTLQTADGRTLVLMNPAYMSRQMAERLTEPGFRLAIVGQDPLRPGNRADDWERRILATATQGGQVFFSGEDCLPQGRLRLLRTLAAQESCLRCHQSHREGDMLGGISISMDAAAYVHDLERKQRELGLLYGLLALTGVLAVGGITSNLTLRRLQAEEKSRLKSAFMGRLSHDMRTPLAAMLGMSDLLDRQDCGTEQRHTALAYLRRACGALLEMVDDITDHASLEQGDVRLRCRTFDLPACLRACADLYRPAAEGKGLELLLHLAPHLPRQVRGDGFRLRQALGNLVSNAVKFTERGRVDVEAGGERLASGVFLLRQAMMGISNSLCESARIDGASHWIIFWKIILPLVKPSMATLAILKFVWTWNDSLFAVASSDGERVDSGFGNATVFRVYRKTGSAVEQVGEIRVDTSSPTAGGSHRAHIRAIVDSLGDCGNVVVREIGEMPSRMLADAGVTVLISDGPITDALSG